MTDEPLLPPGPRSIDATHSAHIGSHDGQGAGDNDQAFFGFRSYQFATHELARLLLRRSELLDAKLGSRHFLMLLAKSRRDPAASSRSDAANAPARHSQRVARWLLDFASSIECA